VRITAIGTAVVVMVMTVTMASAQIVGPGPQLKIGYINSAEILEKYSCAKDAEAKLKKELDKWGVEVQNREAELKSLQDQLEKQSMLLSMEKKKELADSLQKKYAAYQEYGQKKQNEAMTRRVELYKPVEDSVNKLIQKVGLDEKYDIIFYAINGRVVYALPKYDLTERIVDLLPACSNVKTVGKPEPKKEAVQPKVKK
jgi:outer membrane protein